jgi:hypothetical protein
MDNKPNVIVNCTADRYAQAGERVIEVTFSDRNGALVSFSDNGNKIEVYRYDTSVRIVNAETARANALTALRKAAEDDETLTVALDDLLVRAKLAWVCPREYSSDIACGFINDNDDTECGGCGADREDEDRS